MSGVPRDFGVDIISLQMQNQFPCGLVNALFSSGLFIAKVLVRRTSEIEPAGITPEGGPVRGSIAGHDPSRYLPVHRHNYVVAVPIGRHTDPSLIS
jgi:hypothetical protein